MKLSDRERDILGRWPVVTDRDIEQMNDEFAHYIFFRRRKDGGMEYHASCCGHRQQIEGTRRIQWPWENELLEQSRHNAEGACPWCGRKVTMKDLARANGVTDTKYSRAVVAAMEKWREVLDQKEGL